MRIFMDMITGAEVLSDSYPMTLLFDGAACEVQSSLIAKVDDNDYVEEYSEEQEHEAQCTPIEKVIDLIDTFEYVETSIAKIDWQKAFKEFIKEILEKRIANGESAESIAIFHVNANFFANTVIEKFADLTIYTPNDSDPTHSLIYSYWKEGNKDAPVFLFYLDGCKEYKF